MSERDERERDERIVVRVPVMGKEAQAALEAMRKMRRPGRSCHDCVYCVWDGNLWLRTLASGFPLRPMCANHLAREGKLSEVPLSGPCRNFRARPKPPVRVAPPEPPNDEVAYIPLTRGLFAIVDAADYPELSKYKWYAQRGGGTFYAARSSNGRVISMHRQIMQPPEGMVVDHINGNGVNNRRRNLRVCTQLQNSQNNQRASGKSRFRGVFPRGDKWEAHIQHNGEQFYLGLFDAEVEAARARDRKAFELAGEFAFLNFPDELQTE